MTAHRHCCIACLVLAAYFSSCGDSDPNDEADDCSVQAEICNGADDNCDGAIDEGFPEVGLACTVGVGACAVAGTVACAFDEQSTLCVAQAGSAIEELCGNGADDDCDGAVDEGFDQLTEPCDGADADLCMEGSWQCVSGVAVCDDQNDVDPDTCDALDNDCNPATLDGADDTRYGDPCDGADTDACIEGVFTSCSVGELQCGDPNDDTTQNDSDNCGTCGNACENPNGTTSCVSGACSPVCTFGWQACGDVDDGCATLRDTTPACLGFTQLQDVSGDGGGTSRIVTGYSEAFYLVRITETDPSVDDVTARVTLASPAGVNFGVCVLCANCGGLETCDNTEGVGGSDSIKVLGNDTPGEDAYDIIIRV
ncbi:MAG TPA: hypothetical protein VLC93_04615, partial [Myxococcota bacterium]|nr:hypothetical protein [Myxococcota bacterium]